MQFDKYQGLGNDFVLVWEPSLDRSITAQEAKILCDRHFGVGADGVLLLSPRDDSYQMVIYNADGTRPEMCGNGLRCAAFYLAKGLIKGPSSVPVRVHTDAGIRDCLVQGDGTSNEALVTVGMGQASEVQAKTIVLGERQVELQCLSMGNPHAVLFGDYSEEQIAGLGPELSRHKEFPQGVNVGFAQVQSDESIKLVVWERGVGKTLACGTGACAAVVAAEHTGRVKKGQSHRVMLPGGELSVQVSGKAVTMTGPAVRVYSGDWG